MILTKDKVRGMLVGGAIGDALGMPVEIFSIDKIKEKYPEGVKKYESPSEHKWFTDDPNNEDPNLTYMEPGMTTDDTQLTVATMKALNAARGFCLDEQAIQHSNAYKNNICGWGRSTTEAIRRLSNGVSWKESGKTNNPHRGTGNGIPMKCSPLAAYYTTFTGIQDKDFWQKVIDYSAMTHYTKMSAISGVVHVQAVWFCLVSDPENFTVDGFLNTVCNEAVGRFVIKSVSYDHLNTTDDKIENRLNYLCENRDKIASWTPEEIAAEFGAGSCYVYHSLPFSYAHFIQNPYDFETVLRCVNGGGDTDTNAKIVSELIGALNGYSFFEQPDLKWTLEGLKEHDELLSLADEFCEIYEIE